jgi:pilus assembly protein CpaE
MTMRPLSAALVVADRVLREETSGCIANLPVRVVIDQKALDDVDDLLDRIERTRADVLLLEAGLLKVPLEEFAKRLKLTASEPVIFILHTDAVAKNILEAMQAGAREYICPPLAAPLRDALERLSGLRLDQASHQQKKLGRIVGFLSAKGGSGATTFTSHVATIAARHSEKRVLLADLDFEAGLLRFILKAKPRYSLRDALDNMHRMDSSYWNALVIRHGDKLEFIAAPEDLTERALPDPRQLGRLLRFIRSLYPVTFVDFGRCYSAAAIESLPELDTLFLIVTQDLLTLENAKDFIRMAGERGKGAERIRVLINKVPGKQKTDLDGLENYLEVRPAGVFTDDGEALYETWSEGRLLGHGSVLGRQMETLAKSIMTEDPVEIGVNRNRPALKPAAALPVAAAPSGENAFGRARGLGRFFSFMRSSFGAG